MVHRNRGSLAGLLEVFVGVCEYVVSLILKELLFISGSYEEMNLVILAGCILLH